MDQRGNLFTVLADEQKIQRKAAKKAQLDEDRRRRRHERETEEKVSLVNAKWADVSDSTDEESSGTISVSTDESSEEVAQPVDITITFGGAKKGKETVKKNANTKKNAVKKDSGIKDDDDFLNALADAAPAPKKKAPITKPKPKNQAPRSQPVDAASDPDVIAAKEEVAKAKKEYEKARGSTEKQAKKILLQKAQNAVSEAENRVILKARIENRVEAQNEAAE